MKKRKNVETVRERERERERESSNLKTIELKIANKPHNQKTAPNNKQFDVKKHAIKNTKTTVGVGTICDPTAQKNKTKPTSNVPTSNLQPPTSNTAISLVALVITIIVLLILAGVTLSAIMGKNGIFSNANKAKEANQQEIAKEKINLKITNIQMEYFSKKQELPKLQNLADELCNDIDIQYVETKSQSKISSLLPIIDTTNCDIIYTKLKEYPYEFGINSSLQLAYINGIKIAAGNTGNEEENENKIQELERNINTLEEKVNELKNSLEQKTNELSRTKQNLTWKSLGSAVDSGNIANEQNIFEYEIPSDANEVIVYYGVKNGNQIYGGGTIHLVVNTIVADTGNHPTWCPVYYHIEALKGFVYTMISNGKLIINMCPNSTDRLRATAYYR